MVKKLYTEEQIHQKIKDLAKEIEKDTQGEKIVMIGILKGAVVFVSDLMREIKKDVELDFMAVSSYGDKTESSGVVQLLKDIDVDIEGRDVVIVEDIVDTGLTLDYLKRYLLQRKPRSIRIATLLDKSCRREVEIDIDYVGFEIEDVFVVGYGIDYAQRYRNLPYVGRIEE